jgi:hypothetical protein
MGNESETANSNVSLDTWNRERTMEELRNFVNQKHDLLRDIIVE